MRRILLLFCCLLAVPLQAALAAVPSNPALAAGDGGRVFPPKMAHVVVALCDNAFQGIVPVKPELGNGADPARNLYWGAMYGVKTFMAKQSGWTVIHKQEQAAPMVLERLVFRHEGLNLTVVADAWQGMAIRDATATFLNYCAGLSPVDIFHGENNAAHIRAGGGADLLIYVGHNGLMDFSLPFLPANVDGKQRQAAVFACAGKNYFSESLKKAGAHPLIWTTGLMAPEAYVLHALLMSWGREDTPENTREEVAKAYNTYQKCGMNGARRLFATGF